MKTSSRFSPEVRKRAVRLVLEYPGEHDSPWAAIGSMAGKIGCTAETWRQGLRRTEDEAGQRGGPTGSAPERLKDLEREHRELNRANEIRRKAAACFAPAELDRRPTGGCRSSMNTRPPMGSSRSVPSGRLPH